MKVESVLSLILVSVLVMVGFQPLGRLGYQLDWIDGGLEFTDKGLVFGPSVRFGLEGLFIKKYSMFGLARLSNQLGSSSGIH